MLEASHLCPGQIYSDQSGTRSDLGISGLLNTSEIPLCFKIYGSGKDSKSAAVAGGIERAHVENKAHKEPSQIEMNT